jgi:crotonobetaine/carnitine-CoA ligase
VSSINPNAYLDTEDSLLATFRLIAQDDGEKEFVRFPDATFSYGDALQNLEAIARGLLALGLEPGDRVGIMADNEPEALWAWLGADAARLIDVPFNTAARGNLLEYFVRDAEPRVVIATPEYLEILAGSIDFEPEVVVSIGDSPRAAFGDRARHMTFDELRALGASSDVPLPDPGPGETATIMFTSGTTGPSKGVMLPQRYYSSFGAIFQLITGLRSDDVVYTAQPIYHIDPRAYLCGVIYTRATIVVASRFSVSRFWDDIRAHGVTVFGAIGTMMWLLYKCEPSPDDADNPVRLCACSSLPYEVMSEFESRFGLKVVEGYGMTECVCIAQNAPEEYVPGMVGRPAPHVEVAILDDLDNEVERGTAGQICFRPRTAFVTASGYWRKPAETIAAWRNLWFHTGDLGRQREDGELEFIGRVKDSIRRRGENISAWEVEQAISAHPDVIDAAAIGVPSEVGEEDVAVLLVPAPGRTPDPAALVEFVERDLPRFAVPRYIEFVDELPKTASFRVAKDKVKERGITEAAWDANAALGRR